MRVRRFAPIPRLTIVTFHHIADQGGRYQYDPDVADATPAQFRRQMETLARHCTVITMDDCVRAVEGAPLPQNPVLVTFDDGYRSCHDTALPVLKSVGIPATFFIATSYITERRLYWWERIALVLSRTKVARTTIMFPDVLEIVPHDPIMRRKLTDLIKFTPALDIERFLVELTEKLEVEWSPAIEAEAADGLIMKWDHIRTLAREGMDIESHTRRHRVLQTLDAAALRDELSGSRLDLEAQIGRPVRAVAYPVGRAISEVPRIRAAVQEAGYRIGLSNGSGVNTLWPAQLRSVLPIDRFDIRRLSTDRSMSDAMFLTSVAIPSLAY
ncbi:MAG: polysaccharide deacetylase family protein [Deltaproteobacteria bacterium]|nr:polysaccharide deacetylase family protein [Deltaproteobacteria bacterium]